MPSRNCPQVCCQQDLAEELSSSLLCGASILRGAVSEVCVNHLYTFDVSVVRKNSSRTEQEPPSDGSGNCRTQVCSVREAD